MPVNSRAGLLEPGLVRLKPLPIRLILRPDPVTAVEYPAYFFPGTTASLQAFATLNFTTVFAGILMWRPVLRFRPILALRFDFTSLPIPGIINWPFFFVSATAVAAMISRIPLAVALVCLPFLQSEKPMSLRHHFSSHATPPMKDG